MDATTGTVLVGLGVAIITGITSVIVAFVNNRKERTGSADEGVEAVLRERLILGEDRLEAAHELIEDLRRELARCTCQGDVT